MQSPKENMEWYTKNLMLVNSTTHDKGHCCRKFGIRKYLTLERPVEQRPLKKTGGTEKPNE